MKQTLFLILPAFVALGGTGSAADITLSATDAFNTTSFNVGTNWPGGAAPVAGNDYFTGDAVLRTPADASSPTFAGDSLTVNNTGAYPQGLFYKGTGTTATTGTITVNNLILDGGIISHGQGDIHFFNLAGNIAVVSNSTIWAKQGPTNIFASISGSGTITAPVPDADIVSRTLTFHSTTSTFTGSLINNGRFVLADDAVFNFVIGASGVNNSITGTGSVTNFDGDFVIDLTNATANLGDTWTLTTGSTYGPTFTVQGWTQTAPGVWRDPSNSYRFTTANGTLAVDPDDDSDGLQDLWEDEFFGDNDGIPTPAELALQDGLGDPDTDGLTNALEQTAGTNPTNPDTDDDGINDGPEVNGTNNALVSHGYGATNPLLADSDNDTVNDGDEISGALNTGNSNAPTNPNALDTDADTLPDGYELANNTPGTALNPNDAADANAGVDNDGDGLDNIDEFTATIRTRADLADTDNDGYSDFVEDNFGSWDSATRTGTNPTNPDTDGDGLLDGQENLDSGTPGGPIYNSDPNLADTDGDQFSDRYEVQVASTNPNDNTSVPTQPAGWNLIENFEGTGMTIGQSFKGVNGWESADDASGLIVVDEPIAGGDQVGSFLRPTGGNSLAIYKSLTSLGLHVLDGKTGTLFLQVHATSTGMDHSFGLSDVATPGGFPDFEAQTALLGATPTHATRPQTGLTNYAGGGYRTGEWINVWIVADNTNDQIKVYIASPDGETGQVDITPNSETTPYVFRNGVAANALSTFFMIENNPAAPALLIDNLYVDPTAANLTSPAPNKPEPNPVAPAITNVAFDSAGNLLLTFTPGGTGYLVTSSNNLVDAFATVTGATFDNVDTFTIPAAELNPGKDFFRIEEAP